jgi:hypothetical protein
LEVKASLPIGPLRYASDPNHSTHKGNRALGSYHVRHPLQLSPSALPCDGEVDTPLIRDLKPRLIRSEGDRQTPDFGPDFLVPMGRQDNFEPTLYQTPTVAYGEADIRLRIVRPKAKRVIRLPLNRTHVFTAPSLRHLTRLCPETKGSGRTIGYGKMISIPPPHGIRIQDFTPLKFTAIGYGPEGL